MAERTSTRTTSRRTTPQPVPSTTRVAASQSPQKRTARVTRSQSHDISDSDATRKGASSRRGAKQGAAEGTDSSTGKTNTKGRKGRPANKSGPLRDLTTVREDPSIVYPEVQLREDEGLDWAPETEHSLPHRSPQTSKSPGGVSAFSGTTVRTSLPVQDSVDSNAVGMLDALPDLSEAADKLLGCLVPSETSNATITSQMTKLHTKGTIASTKWKRLGNAFQAQRELYGSDTYINPSTALQSLIGKKQLSEATAGPWRPDALLQKANLAILASSIFTRPWQEQGDQFIEELEQAFPRCFTEALASSDALMPGHSTLIMETFQFALEVRTQYAITLLDRYSAQQNFDSDIVLHQVFYKNKDVLKGWGVLGLHSENLINEFEAVILKRLAQLRAAFTDFSESAIAGTERLRTTFPWNSFVHDTVAWISKRMKEIEAQIVASGGNQAICESLSSEVQKLRSTRPSMNYDDLVLIYEPPSEASNTASEHQNVASKATPVKVLKMGEFNAESLKARTAAATLKRRMSGRQASKLAEQASTGDAQGPASDIQVASTAETSARAVTPQGKDKVPGIPFSAPPKYHHDDGWQPQVADDEEDEPLPALEREEEVRLDRVLASRDQNEAESNKENIVETQTNLQPPSGQRRLIDRQENATRVAWDSQDTGSNQNASPADLDEGDDFQQQQPPVNASSRRNLTSSNKRTATEAARSQGPSPKKVRIQAANGARAQSIAQNRQSSRPPASQVEEYLAANVAAKERKAWQVKPPQVRKPWTEEETERLLELIEEHGTSWALLKTEDIGAGNILESRDQVALKDKARNMKLDYLKASPYLPKNFHRIPLSKLQVDKLRGLNIRYDPETGLREDAILEDDD